MTMNDVVTETPAMPDSAAPKDIDKGWSAALDDSLRGLVEAKGWRTPADALKSYTHLERMVGGDKITVPGRDARPEEWERLYAKLGRPESAENYDLGDFMPPPELPWDPAIESSMLEAMHRAGLSSRQARALVSHYAEIQSEAVARMRAALGRSAERASDELRRAWGAEYGARLDMANRAFAHAAGEERDGLKNLRLADGSLLGNHPLVIRAFARLGEGLGEHGLAGRGGRHLTITPEDAKAEIQRLHSDPTAMQALTDKSHPDYESAVAKRKRLYEIAYPDE